MKNFVKEQNQILESLEEGIIVVKNDEIQFINHLLQEITSKLVKNSSLISMSHQVLEAPIFKVFRQTQLSDNKSPEVSNRQASVFSGRVF